MPVGLRGAGDGQAQVAARQQHAYGVTGRRRRQRRAGVVVGEDRRVAVAVLGVAERALLTEADAVAVAGAGDEQRRRGRSPRGERPGREQGRQQQRPGCAAAVTATLAGSWWGAGPRVDKLEAMDAEPAWRMHGGARERAPRLRPVRRVLGGGGRQVRVRHPGRGNTRPQRITRRLIGVLHPCSPRAGRGLHGRHVRAAHRTRGRVPRNARPGSHQPRHGRRRRLPRSGAARRPDRSRRPRAHAQGIPPVHRPRRGDAPDHEVERARHEPGDHPRGRAQGLQARRVREARARPIWSCPRT